MSAKSRPRTPSSSSSSSLQKTFRYVRRWPQIAATTAVPVITFRGIQEIPGHDDLLGIKPSPPPDNGHPDEHTMVAILDDTQCQQAADNVFDLSPYDIPFLLRLGEYFRLKAQDSAIRGDYKDATESAQKREIVVAEYRARRKPPPSREEVHEYSRMIRQRQEAWEREVADFDAITQDHLDFLRRRHEEELEEFDSQWEGPVQDKYRKPSAALIRQRILEADMIHRDEIERAKFIHEGVRIMEEKEFVEAQQLYDVGYNDARAGKIAIQSGEKQRYCWQRECERLFLIRKIEKEEQVLANRLNVLQEKPPNSEPFKGRVIDPVPTRPVVVTDTSCNPGAKLPKLTFRGRARTAVGRHTSAGSTGTSRRNFELDEYRMQKQDHLVDDGIRDLTSSPGDDG
jgi:hypothetical protein